ncbi:hypothetical protein DFH06DRAFT_1256178 [Mycena polygramma]|nr:hypothetical protein DFH06DRAFT_1256178 [Mycena polygramma]
MESSGLRLRGRLVPPITATPPVTVPALVPPLEDDSPDSDTSTLTPISSSPPAPAIPALESIINVVQLTTDLERGQFSVPNSRPCTPQDNSPVPVADSPPSAYVSPPWLASLVQHFLDLGPRHPLQLDPDSLAPPTFCIFLGIQTTVASGVFVYSPQQLASLDMHRTPPVLPDFIQTLCRTDMSAGGNIIRLLREYPHDTASPLMLALSTQPIPVASNFRDPQAGYQEIMPLKDCWSSESDLPSCQLLPAHSGVQPELLPDQLSLPASANVYVLYIVQNGTSDIPVSLPDSTTPTEYLSTFFAKELQIIGSLDPARFGTAYIHFTRYRLLSRITAATGLRLDKPAQTSSILLPSPSTGRVTLTCPLLLGWAGIHPGVFGNHKALMVKADQRRLVLEGLPELDRGSADANLLANLRALACDPEDYPQQSPLPLAVKWKLTDLATALDPETSVRRRRRPVRGRLRIGR